MARERSTGLRFWPVEASLAGVWSEATTGLHLAKPSHSGQARLVLSQTVQGGTPESAILGFASLRIQAGMTSLSAPVHPA